MSETREEVDAVKVIYAAEFCESLTARQVQSLLDTLALKAGLESDGLVVLRYEGDAVTVAGRLDTRVIGPEGDDRYPLYRMVAPPSPRSAQ
jgi:S-adenosylmethionine:diacylglycerol 3-amino-3-carboxypropyl transferase